jgi:hypothetical protein
MPTITTAVEVYHVHPTQLDQVLELLGELDSPESNGVRITVQRPRIQASAPYATSADVTRQIELGEVINDSAAVAIASWYATARGVGQTFNELATGRPVAVDELLDAVTSAIANTLLDVGLAKPDTSALQALARWVEQSADEN